MGHLRRAADLPGSRLVAVPVSPHEVTFSVGVEALRRQDAERRAREDRMRNALEILQFAGDDAYPECRAFCQFVRATAREGLGRE